MIFQVKYSVHENKTLQIKDQCVNKYDVKPIFSINIQFKQISYQLRMSWCCHQQEPEYKYEVTSIQKNHHGIHQQNYQYYHSLEDVRDHVKENADVSITKVKTQLGFGTLKGELAKNKQQFTDETFPPNSSSLGNVEDCEGWKRIPQLIKNMTPVLFDKKIQPSDVIAGHEGDCYLLSSLAALAEFPNIIKKIFRDQEYNPQGIYKLNLRIDGVVEEVVVDDYVPVHKNGLPLFCQPNKKTGQFWVLLLQKALAKIQGTYQHLQQGIPSWIFRAVTYAPSESLVFSQQSQETQNVWDIIKQYTHNYYPFCATTKNSNQLEHLGLESAHTYTIIQAVQLQSIHGKQRVVKLRNPWKQVNYKGKGSIHDKEFWESIKQSGQKTLVLSVNNTFQYGLFYMAFQDFCLHFSQIHYCNLNKGGKFFSEPVLLTNKACFFDVVIQKQDVYTFELNQSKIKEQQKNQERQVCRSTLLLIKKSKNQQNVMQYSFINGTMKYHDTNTTLTEKLTPGSYIIYSKIDPTLQTNKFPNSVIINLYSKSVAYLHPAARYSYPNLIRDAFLDYALHNKKQQYVDGKIWVSWQLLFQKGGFAYLAAGNYADSQQNIIINFNQEDFNNLHFKLKKPLKGLGKQTIKIPPGEANIIIARLINNPKIQSAKFPPKLDIKLEPHYS